MKNKTYFKSVWKAIQGLVYALKTEKNYKYHTLIACIFFILNIFLNAKMWGWIGSIVAYLGVMAAETANTVIEHILNMISRDIREDIRVAKDMGAGIVLWWGITFFVVEGIIIADYLQLFQ